MYTLLILMHACGHRKCTALDCLSSASFGLPGLARCDATRCFKHKTTAMVNIRSGRCAHPSGCDKHRRFGLPGMGVTHCSTHRTTDMVKHMQCEHDGCSRGASYGLPEAVASLCARHKAPGMVIKYAPLCDVPTGCVKRACCSLPGTAKFSRCMEHKAPGMVNGRLCDCPGGCTTQATFGPPGDKLRSRCAAHKEPGMIAKYASMCADPSGCQRIAFFGLPGAKRSRCAVHKEPGMENRKRRKTDNAKLCDYPSGCTTRANFGPPGDKLRTRCAAHTEPGMIAKYASLCADPSGCQRIASYGLLGAKRSRCMVHKEPGMEGRKRRKADSARVDGQLTHAAAGKAETDTVKASKAETDTVKASKAETEELPVQKRRNASSAKFVGQLPASLADAAASDTTKVVGQLPASLAVKVEASDASAGTIKTTDAAAAAAGTVKTEIKIENEHAYRSLSELPFDAAELARLRARWLATFIAERPTEYVTRQGTSRATTALKPMPSRLWRIHERLWQRMTHGGKDVDVSWAEPIDLLFWLRCLDLHTATCHRVPVLPGVLLDTFGLGTLGTSGPDDIRMADIVDLTGIDDDEIDVETFVMGMVWFKSEGHQQ